MVLNNDVSGAVQQSRPQNDFPDYDEDGLAARMRLTVATIRAWRCRHHEKLPPGIKVGRRWLYNKMVVEQWLAASRPDVTAIQPLAIASNSIIDEKRRPGRPRKNPEPSVSDKKTSTARRPISERGIWDRINQACLRMDPAQAYLWEAIKIVPEKWLQSPYGASGGGFWVVAVIGRLVIWFNDIEGGFNCSSYSRYGVIDDYWRDRDELECAVQRVMSVIEHGQRPSL